MNTIQELYTECENHDWTYQFSDDHSVWRRGMAAEARLEQLAATVPGGKELVLAFSKYIFSGPAYGTENAPKPPRP